MLDEKGNTQSIDHPKCQSLRNKNCTVKDGNMHEEQTP